MRKLFTRSLSCILAVLLVFGTVSTDVYAAGLDGDDIQALTVSEDELIGEDEADVEAEYDALADGDEAEESGEDESVSEDGLAAIDGDDEIVQDEDAAVPEEDIISVDEEQEESADELADDEAGLSEADGDAEDGSDVETENATETSDRKYHFGGNYIDMPGKKAPAVVDDSVTYLDMLNALRDNDDEISQNYATPLAKYSGPFSRAYPFSHEEESALLSYLNDTYPSTRDQDPWGTCWAHSVMGMLEFYLVSHGLTDRADPDLSNPRDIDLSELQLAYWNYANKGTPGIAGRTGDTVKFTTYKYTAWDPDKWRYVTKDKEIIDLGGNSYLAAQTLMQNRGAALESAVPYTTENQALANGTGLDQDTERGYNAVTLKNSYVINKKNRKLAKEAILSNGGVGMSFFSDDYFYNSSTGAYFNKYYSYSNHAVMIVGWDDDYPRTNFQKWCRPKKNGAWLVRNSWTTSPYINDYYSYFWMSYEEKSIQGYWVFEPMDQGDPQFDNAYFYDSQMHDWTHTKAKKSANVYQVKGGEDGTEEHETLQAVTFDVEPDYSNVNYTVEVYRDITDPSKGPANGELVPEATTKGTLTIGGTYTIVLDTPVVLDKDTYYAVAVSLSNGKSVNYELKFNYWKGLKATVHADPGQSFIYNSGKWTDFGKKNKKNLVIHALTTNGEVGGSVDIDEEEISFTDKITDTVDLDVTVYDEEDAPVEDPDLIWKSSDEGIAKVDQDGVVTPVGNGTAQITAASHGFKDVCDVTVDIVKHTVTLDGCGGYFKTKNSKGKTVYPATMSYVLYHGTVFTADEPVRVRHTFSGFTDSEKSQVIKYDPSKENDKMESIPVEDDYNFKAVWTPVETTGNVTISTLPNRDASPVHVGDRIIMSTLTDEADIYYSAIVYTDSAKSDMIAVIPESEDEEYCEYKGPIRIGKAGYYEVTAYAERENQARSAKSIIQFEAVSVTEDSWGDIISEDREVWGIDEHSLPVTQPSGLWIASGSYAATAEYTGTPVVFDGLRVYNGNRLLEKDRDYTVTYSNNTNLSTSKKKAAFTVKFKGNVAGSMKQEFDIVPAQIENVEAEDVTEGISSGAISPAPEVFYNGIKLVSGRDYTYEYYEYDDEFDPDAPAGESLNSITSSGKYLILLKGKGNFTGTRTVGLTVTESKSISDAKVEGFESEIVFPADPAVTNVTQTMADTDHPNGLKLSSDGELLKPGTDYEISYKHNDRPGEAVMIIRGKGGYSGVVSKPFNVRPIKLTEDMLKASSFEYNLPLTAEMIGNHRAEQTAPELVNGEFDLVKDTDYTIAYKNNTAPGNATMVVTGTGRYSGTINKKFVITALDMSKADGLLKISNMDEERAWYQDIPVYSSTSVIDIGNGYHTPAGAKPRICLTFDGTELVKGRDYTIKYADNKKAPSPVSKKYPSVTITGKGLFKGKIKCKFAFNPNQLKGGMDYTPENSTVRISVSDKAWSKKKKGLYSTPSITDISTGKKLKAGRDYSKSYSYTYAIDTVLSNGAVRRAGDRVQATDVIMPGTDTLIKVTVNGNYYTRGTYKQKYRYWTYRSTYNTEQYYTGQISATYRVKSKGVLNSATVKINGGKAYTYTGEAIEPGKDDIVIKIGKKTYLTSADYDIISYENNVNAGTAKLKIKGKGLYGGEKTVTFKIAQPVYKAKK